MLGGRRLPFSAARLVVEQGAGALLSRHATPEGVVALVQQLIGGGAAQPLAKGVVAEPTAPYAAALTGLTTSPVLSRRELEVLRLVVDELGNAEIAARLSLSVRTVESHRSALLLKTGTRSMVGLALLAVRQGWVSVERA
ncbi:MAG: response regulator transcription factor [Hymenobacteraceae bacterium]|nr:response regulator transcription factor [Hymenobacteraceae bacterium]